MRIPRLLIFFACLSVSTPTVSAVLEPLEGPSSYRCDDSGIIVCASVGVGTRVVCDETPTHAIACDWTRGVEWGAFTQTGLPGEAYINMTGAVVLCSNFDGCTRNGDAQQRTCAFHVLNCNGAHEEHGALPIHQLRFSECVQILATQYARIEAHVMRPGAPLASTWYEESTESGQAFCWLDDGREP